MKTLFVFIVLVLLIACESDKATTTRQEDFSQLQATFESIQAIVNEVSCVDGNQWRFTPFGEKACGGPQGFLAYPITIDTVDFLNRIEGYRLREEFLNKKWKIMSTCEVPPVPQSVDCVNDLPVIVY